PPPFVLVLLLVLVIDPLSSCSQDRLRGRRLRGRRRERDGNHESRGDITNSSAWYELRTIGPLATCRNPMSRALSPSSANLAGVTNSTTGKCFKVGWRYWPIVKMSQRTRRKSARATINSDSVSPRPSIRPDLVWISWPRLAFTLPNTLRERS